MATGSVVARLYVVEDIGAFQVPGLGDTLLDSLLVQTAAERLDNSIVLAAAAPAHAGLEVVGCTEALEVIAPMLTALVAVNQNGPYRIATPHGH